MPVQGESRWPNGQPRPERDDHLMPACSGCRHHTLHEPLRWRTSACKHPAGISPYAPTATAVMRYVDGPCGHAGTLFEATVAAAKKAAKGRKK